MSSKRTKTYRSFSSETTKRFGETLAGKMTHAPLHGTRGGAIVLALKGDLGAGKTTFVQGFFKGLGIKARAPSPTFVIMRHYSMPRGKARNGRKYTDVFHADAYRLKGGKHLAALGFRKILADSRNMVLIEWAERVKALLPKGVVWIAFRHGKRENERSITMKR